MLFLYALNPWTAPAFWALRQAAVMRHMLAGVYGTPLERELMRRVYGF